MHPPTAEPEASGRALPRPSAGAQGDPPRAPAPAYDQARLLASFQGGSSQDQGREPMCKQRMLFCFREVFLEKIDFFIKKIIFF